ncbi:hypothetical protein BHM03_00024688 [Ensete ventricosum]|nr:hypothetical protein BHM03_00024688 [Ensete ventricosum]
MSYKNEVGMNLSPWGWFFLREVCGVSDDGMEAQKSTTCSISLELNVPLMVSASVATKSRALFAHPAEKFDIADPPLLPKLPFLFKLTLIPCERPSQVLTACFTESEIDTGRWFFLLFSAVIMLRRDCCFTVISDMSLLMVALHGQERVGHHNTSVNHTIDVKVSSMSSELVCHYEDVDSFPSSSSSSSVPKNADIFWIDLWIRRTTESEASEASRSDHTKRGGGGDAPLFGERRLPTMECATSPVVVFFFFFSRLLFLRHDVFCATLLLESAYRPTLESQSNNTVCLLLQDANGHHCTLPFPRELDEH